MKFKMLDLVEEMHTGFKGRVNGYSEGLVGVPQVSIQAPVKADGTYADGYNIDEPNLKFLESWDGDDVNRDVSFDAAKFDIGELVEHMSGFRGKVTSRTVTMNGCYLYRLTALHKGEVKYETFNEPGLTSVAESTFAKQEVRTGSVNSTPMRSKE